MRAMAKIKSCERRAERVFTTDPGGVPRDECELALLVDADGEMRFAWFDSFHYTGGNRVMSKETVRRMVRTMNDWLEGSL